MSQYVRTGQRAGMGRVARSHYVPRVGRLPRSAALGNLSRAEMNALHRRLGQLDYSAGTTVDTSYAGALIPTPALVPSTPSAQTYQIGTSAGNPVYASVVASTPATTPASSSGWTPAQEASVLTSAINAAGVVGKQAIIGSPTVSYNPATGQYTATGGATLPSGLALSSSLSSLLSNPMILLAIAGIVVVMAVK